MSQHSRGTLAEHLSLEGICPIPNTHDRLHETHYWWHEMARNYHEPDPFRYSLGAFIQSARSVTFMLQKEERQFEDFSWYRKWAEEAGSHATLRWLKEIRPAFVHRQALKTESWVDLRCIDNPRHPGIDEDDDVGKSLINPFICTHKLIASLPREDHPHEFERYWSIEDLNGRELLEACPEIYESLDSLVSEAHRRLGAKTLVKGQEHGPGRPPCMMDTTKHRVMRTVLRDGQEVLDADPSTPHCGEH